MGLMTHVVIGYPNIKDTRSLIKMMAEEGVDFIELQIPFLFMTYMNIPFTYGLEKFCKNAEQVGVNGLIIPDYNLELEKIDQFDKLAKKYNQILIRFISLESNSVRMKSISDKAEGFIYCFSTQGITGVRAKFNEYLTKHLKKVRRYFPLPLAVGFGISTAEHVYSLKGSADIIIVGSAMIKAFEEGGLQKARIKTRELVAACK